jgi:hypothetical protein
MTALSHLSTTVRIRSTRRQALDTLAKHGVKASFFPGRQKIERLPELVERIVADGHMIGNHSYSHWSFKNMTTAKSSPKSTTPTRLLRAFDGRLQHRMRPPHGYVGADLLCYSPCIDAALSIGRTTASTIRIDLPMKCARLALRADPPVPGDIVLMHDDSSRAHDALSVMLPEWLLEGHIASRIAGRAAMRILYHHRTRGRHVEGVHIRGIVHALRALGHDVSIMSFPGADPEHESTTQASSKRSRLVRAITRLPGVLFECSNSATTRSPWPCMCCDPPTKTAADLRALLALPLCDESGWHAAPHSAGAGDQRFGPGRTGAPAAFEESGATHRRLVPAPLHRTGVHLELFP